MEQIEKKEQPASSTMSDAVQCRPVEVVVGDRGLDRAVKHLKRKLATEGILRELKRRRHHMKPSVKRRKKEAEAARRRRKRIRDAANPPAPKPEREQRPGRGGGGFGGGPGSSFDF